MSARQAQSAWDEQQKYNPLQEAMELDQRQDDDVNEAFHIEDVLKEDKMKQLLSPGDFDKYYGHSLENQDQESSGALDKGIKLSLDRLDLT